MVCFFPTKGHSSSNVLASASKYPQFHTPHIDLRVLRQALQSRQHLRHYIIGLDELTDCSELRAGNAPDFRLEVVEVFQVEWQEEGAEELFVEDLAEVADPGD